MSIIKEIIIAIYILALFVIFFFMMKKLDRFLEENRKSIRNQDEIKQPCCLMLTGELSDDEIADEIRKFRQQHNKTTIILTDSSDIELP